METTPTASAALVLSGGGAFGAYEVGVVNALCHGRSSSTNFRSLDAAIFAGTSVGGFNAAVLAMSVGGTAAAAETLTDLWLQTIADQGDGRGNGVYRVRGDFANYLDPRLPGSPIEQLARALSDAGAFGSLFARSTAGFLSTHGSLLSRAASQVDLSVLMNTEPFEHLVRNSIQPDVLRQSGKTLSVTTTSWRTGKPRGFSFGDMTDEQTWAAIRASAAIPCLFPAVLFPNDVATSPEYYIDGGVVMNTPISAAIRCGASEVHVISLTPDLDDCSAAYSETTFDNLGRVLLATVEANIRQNMDWVEKMNDVFEILGRDEASVRIWEKLVSDQMPPQRITVHRYYPKATLGGIVGMLNFEKAVIEATIQMGQKDAAAHDCDANGCIRADANS